MVRFTAAAIALAWTASSASDGIRRAPKRRAATAADERRAHHPLLQDGARDRSAAHTRPFGLGGPPRRSLRAQRRLDLSIVLVPASLRSIAASSLRFSMSRKIEATASTLPFAAIAHEAIARSRCCLRCRARPMRGMADVVDRHVVVLAPEERDIGKPLPSPEHVARRGLALPLGHHPVLDPQMLAAMGDPASARCRRRRKCPARWSRDIRSPPRRGRSSSPARSASCDSRPHADADDHEIGRQCGAALELDALAPSIAVAVSSRWNTTPCSS